MAILYVTQRVVNSLGNYEDIYPKTSSSQVVRESDSAHTVEDFLQTIESYGVRTSNIPSDIAYGVSIGNAIANIPSTEFGNIFDSESFIANLNSNIARIGQIKAISEDSDSWIDMNTGTFFFGDEEQYIEWDGKDLKVIGNGAFSGEINANNGSIGGFTIDSSSIHTKDVDVTSNAEGSIALSSEGFKRKIGNYNKGGLMFSIGDKFGVNKDGTLYASSADISGIIMADSGVIGRFVFDEDAISHTQIYLDEQTTNSGNIMLSVIDRTTTVADTTISDARFYIGDNFAVSANGVLYANEAQITGNINATSGIIGGCSIEDGVLKIASANITDLTKIGDDTNYVSVDSDGIEIVKDSDTSVTFGDVSTSGEGIYGLIFGDISKSYTEETQTRLSKGSIQLSTQTSTISSTTTITGHSIYIIGENFSGWHINNDSMHLIDSDLNRTGLFSVFNTGEVMAKSATINGVLTANSATIGTNFTINTSGYLSSDLIPSTTNSISIGSTSSIFSNVRSMYLYAGNSSIYGRIYVHNGKGYYTRIYTAAANTTNGILALKLDGTLNLSGSGTLSPSGSDRRLKSNIKDSEMNATDIVEKIKMRQFDWISSNKHQDVGFVTQELQEIDENLIYDSIGSPYEKDENGETNWTPQSVNAFYLQGVVVKAMQEMLDRIKYLESKL